MYHSSISLRNLNRWFPDQNPSTQHMPSKSMSSPRRQFSPLFRDCGTRTPFFMLEWKFDPFSNFAFATSPWEITVFLRHLNTFSWEPHPPPSQNRALYEQTRVLRNIHRIKKVSTSWFFFISPPSIFLAATTSIEKPSPKFTLVRKPCHRSALVIRMSFSPELLIVFFDRWRNVVAGRPIVNAPDAILQSFPLPVLMERLSIKLLSWWGLNCSEL